ncbi:MAG TPA: isoprenylcysteine carboxylmethyltransferase family protein [Vicinamibacterales bacterium]|nr:isoprenylcysteine carboxylmethyltransferase family protein [Vicinamibacterales bacterium]
MGVRVLVWGGGALFVTALAVAAWWYGVVMGRTMPAGGWSAAGVDAALVTAFALHHSLFARQPIKKAIARLVPPDLVRSLYVWVASLLLLAVFGFWRPIGGEWYSVSGAPGVVLAIVQLAGLGLTARAVARIDPLELAGIRSASRTDGLQIDGPYRVVRHPLYLGWLLMVFGAPHMTGDRLAFAAMTTLYLIVAIPWEERSLRRTFGDGYARYMRAVRWRMIPFIY